MLMLLVPKKKAITRKGLKTGISHDGLTWFMTYICNGKIVYVSSDPERWKFDRVKRSTGTESVKPAQSGFLLTVNMNKILCLLPIFV